MTGILSLVIWTPIVFGIILLLVQNKLSTTFTYRLGNLFGFISFLVRVYTQKVLKFAPLFGETYQSNRLPEKSKELDSIVILSEGKLYFKSTAFLKIMELVFPMFKLLIRILTMVPVFIRDFIYDLVARNRYTLFGKSNTCRIPTTSEKELFMY